ncbi:5'-nucleotidase, lipoprotein e(P4) family [Mesocricetibacter intestinalis]|uniref:5'-nucleotidase, lipoprotein e(P4) family n=1 Tax=Mesocricetibacter intestinalis TaxID=1521930 RepID=UPI00105E7C0F|nr:5'-nucleotidase, lipoprotein e(P4) family [Mesocricetibacter intestinalis]
MKTAKFTFIALGLAAVLSGCSAQHSAKHEEAVVQNQAALGILWMQQSGEYQALAYQAFNAALSEFERSKAAKGKKKAVVVDLDETMMDNSPYAAWQVKNNMPFEAETWTQWVNARQTLAIPGAVEFANRVNAKGGTVFYVSNRRDDVERSATIEDMQKLGFPKVNDKTLLLKKQTSNKAERFKQITAQGYDIVVYVGDNLNDFGEATYRKSNRERRDFVAANRTRFGSKFILLPNPNYGDWEGGLHKDYYKGGAKNKLEIRKATLKAWDGK